jgi:putative component of membrane protein insertase Oxa1/YidC/SpoIIIJ protein YidD
VTTWWGAWLAASVGSAAEGEVALDPLEATVELALRGWRVVSLADGARCSFLPTCSAFAARALRRDGLLGVPLVLDRLARESVARGYPLASDGHHRADPVGYHVRVLELLRGCRAARRAGAGACPR